MSEMAKDVIGLVAAIIFIVIVVLWHRKESGGFRRQLSILIVLGGFVACSAIFYIITGR